MPSNGRYAPSPTGDLHLGNLRTAMLAWAIARRSGAGFVMRMEDLDERVRPEFYGRQLEDLAALGIDWDSLVYQSERQAAYDAAFESLQARGLLYEFYCTRKELAQVASAPHRPPGSYPGTCRNLTEAEREAGRAKLAGTNRGPALRVKTDVRELTVVDEIMGIYTGAVDDFVIRRGDGVYSYNFVSVFDDDDESITQITRGNDLLPSTPRQVYLQQLMGMATPKYYHVPMVFNAEGVRLAKRDGAVTMRALAEFGWESGDVAELIGRSLRLEGVRSASDLPPVQSLGSEPWLVDPKELEAGPRAVLRR
ncbi:MAG: tRNA glutamyl-Q(34) synthetase GluQRS [Ancrocorticia sp.]|nr:tRNA glutamyl-Q(34) synthetase GluQRS [Ancrocorticia sp.]